MHFDKYQIPLSFDIMNSSEEMQTRRAAVRDPNNQRGLLTCAVKCISAINYYKLMWLSLPLVIGIIISWIHGMSTENICNPAKNNNLRNQETFAIFMLTGLIICLLLECPTLPHPPACWELSHLHPKRTRSHSLAAAALALMMKSFSSSAQLWRQKDTQPNISPWAARQHCGPYCGHSQFPIAGAAQRPLCYLSTCTPQEITYWKREWYICHVWRR